MAEVHNKVYKSFISRDDEMRIEYDTIEEEDLLKDGNQPFEPSSNCGTKAMFSFVRKTKHQLLSKDGETAFNTLLKHPYTLPYCLTIMKLGKINEITCEDTVYRVMDMYYSSKSEAKSESSLLKIVCQVRRGKKDEKKTLVTGINFLKVFARDSNDTSIDLTIYDANNMTCAMVYFVVKAMRYIVDYVDLFVGPTNKPDSFTGTILMPHHVDISYKIESTKLAVHLIKDMIKSRKSNHVSVEKKEAFSLLDIGMTPHSVKLLENFLHGKSKFKILEEHIRILEIPAKSPSTSFRCLRGTHDISFKKQFAIALKRKQIKN